VSFPLLVSFWMSSPPPRCVRKCVPFDFRPLVILTSAEESFQFFVGVVPFASLLPLTIYPSTFAKEDFSFSWESSFLPFFPHFFAWPRAQTLPPTFGETRSS